MMQTDPVIPILTRRLRIAFDVEVKIPPFPDKMLEVTPELALFHQALLNDPDLLGRVITRKALHHLHEHLAGMYDGDDGTGWLPHKFFNITASVVRQMTVDQAFYFLADELLDNSDVFQYWALLVLLESHQSNPLPVITDLDSGKPINWQESPSASILYRSSHAEYMLVKIGEENVLAVNLVYFPSTWEVIENLATAAGELEQLGLSAQRLLIVVGGDEPELSPEVQDAIQTSCYEAFPGLPVEIKTIINWDEDSETDPCEIAS